MKKQLSILLLSTFLLASCGWNTPKIKVEAEKKEYEINAKNIQNFSKDVKIEKFGKIEWSQDISVKSQASWKINNISKKEWDKVAKGQIIVFLDDNIGNYWIAVKRSENSLNKAILSYENTKNSYEKSIKDSELAVKKAQSNYDNIKVSTNQNLKEAQSNLQTNDLDSDNSKANLEIKKQEEDLKKAKLDYENTLIKNKETIESNKNITKVQYNSFKKLYTDTMEDLDIILGYTDKNKDKNDNYEDYLGSKNKSTFLEARTRFEEVTKNNSFNEINPTINSEEDIIKYLNKIQKWYEDVINLLDNVDLMFKSSSWLDGILANPSQKASGLSSSLNSSYSSFINFKNTTITFLNTYKNGENSSKLALNLQESNLKITKINAEKLDDDTLITFNKTLSSNKDKLIQAEISLKDAKNALEKVKKDKEIALKQENTNISDARINLSEAQKKYNNLFIKSPISGVISEISVDIWDEVSSNANIFTVVNNTNQEVVISLPQTELEYVTVGKSAKIEYNGNTLWATVKSISTVADSNLNYKTTLKLNTPVSIIGGSVKVIFESTWNKYLLPLAIVKLTSDNKWTVNILIENENEGEKELSIDEIEVELGKIWWNYIEIKSEINKDYKIIETNIKNYDENKYKLVVNK